MAGPSTHVNYISDDGNTYRKKQDASNAAAAGNPTATVSASAPSGLEPRYILAVHPTTGRERKIMISDPANPLFVNGTTITLEEFSGAHSTAMAHAIFSRVGEKRYNR
jgi:hypothetical protein